mgnify:CR=1 FL=1
MTNRDEIIQSMMDKVTDQMVESLKQSITAAVEKEISNSLSKAMLEGEFYRRVNADLQASLKDIYKEIKTAKYGGPNHSPPAQPSQVDAGELFDKASDQLDAVLQTTEKAAVDIMETVEKLQEMQATVSGIVTSLESGGVRKRDREKLKEINDVLGNDLLQIMTTLSFQDLTGQRIKIIIETIKKVERIVLDVYMSTGLMIKARETKPEESEKDFEKLKEEAESTVNKLKGPQLEASQDSVDDLLSSLGLD